MNIFYILYIYREYKSKKMGNSLEKSKCLTFNEIIYRTDTFEKEFSSLNDNNSIKIKPNYINNSNILFSFFSPSEDFTFIPKILLKYNVSYNVDESFNNEKNIKLIINGSEINNNDFTYYNESEKITGVDEFEVDYERVDSINFKNDLKMIHLKIIMSIESHVEITEPELIFMF